MRHGGSSSGNWSICEAAPLALFVAHPKGLVRAYSARSLYRVFLAVVRIVMLVWGSCRVSDTPVAS